MTPSPYRPFPDPRTLDRLTAPIGPGVYELRHTGDGPYPKKKRLILFGRGSHCAWRMSSLLPSPYGVGTRKNEAKRKYVLTHIANIEYRTWAFETREEMIAHENTLKKNKAAYVFGT